MFQRPQEDGEFFPSECIFKQRQVHVLPGAVAPLLPCISLFFVQSCLHHFPWLEWAKDPKSLEGFRFLVYAVVSLYPFGKKYQVLLLVLFILGVLAAVSAKYLFSVWTKQCTKYENTMNIRIKLQFYVISSQY